jgi:phosphoribosylaminoimidazolecarboxamide formyltransferase/IMP cyclohydrolase
MNSISVQGDAMAINTVQTIDDCVAVKIVLMSVWDKTELDILARGLLAANQEMRILSTGGTYGEIQKILGQGGSKNLMQVSTYTGQPEMQGGLVKTLDYKVYLGLLSETYNPTHQEDLQRFGAAAIDMIVANFYPFQKTIASPDATLEAARGNIDIGGPCMVRAAAKNFHRVAVVTDPADYRGIEEELKAGGGRLCLATRFRLAQKAFRLTARYDSAIADYLAGLDFDAMSACYTVRKQGE